MMMMMIQMVSNVPIELVNV